MNDTSRSSDTRRSNAGDAVPLTPPGARLGTGSPTTPSSAPAGVKLPAQKIADLGEAAKTAGCTVINPDQSVATSGANRQHVSPGTKVKYATNPPSYGPHYPAPASDGIYPV